LAESIQPRWLWLRACTHAAAVKRTASPLLRPHVLCVSAHTQVVSEASDAAARGILHHCRAPRLVPQVCDILTQDKSAKLRKHCSGFLLQVRWLRVCALLHPTNSARMQSLSNRTAAEGSVSDSRVCLSTCDTAEPLLSCLSCMNVTAAPGGLGASGVRSLPGPGRGSPDSSSTGRTGRDTHQRAHSLCSVRRCAARPRGDAAAPL
jgi:hypothetical protein